MGSTTKLSSYGTMSPVQYPIAGALSNYLSDQIQTGANPALSEILNQTLRQKPTQLAMPASGEQDFKSFFDNKLKTPLNEAIRTQVVPRAYDAFNQGGLSFGNNRQRNVDSLLANLSNTSAAIGSKAGLSDVYAARNYQLGSAQQRIDTVKQNTLAIGQDFQRKLMAANTVNNANDQAAQAAAAFIGMPQTAIGNGPSAWGNTLQTAQQVGGMAAGAGMSYLALAALLAA